MRIPRIQSFLRNVPRGWTMLVNGPGLIIVLMTVAAVVRLYMLGIIPPGMNQDEASVAYDAYAVLRAGIDRHGVWFPVMFEGIGPGMHPLAGYASMPFMWLFGLTPFSARLASALLSIASLPAAYLLARRLWDRHMAIVALFLFAIAPWHIMAARWSHEFNFLPPLLMIGVCVLVLAGDKRSLLPWAAVPFGLALYSYGTALFVVPVFLLLSLSYLFFQRRIDKKNLIDFLLVFFVLALPMALYVFINLFHLPSIITPFFTIPLIDRPAHFQTTASLFRGDFSRVGLQIVTLWKLIWTQNDGLLYNAIPAYGILYLFSAWMYVLGMATLPWKQMRQKYDPHWFLIFWLITGIGLAVSFSSINLNRINMLFPCLTFLVLATLRYLQPVKILYRGILVLYVLSFLSFIAFYFTDYGKAVGPRFFYGAGEAIRYVAERADGKICVTEKMNLPYVHALFYSGISPRVFLETVAYGDARASIPIVKSFGNFVFSIKDCKASGGKYFVVRHDEESLFGSGYIIKQYGDFRAILPRP